MADPNRQYWNKQFKYLQDTWPKQDDFDNCIRICLELHAMVHSKVEEQDCSTSFEDELWQFFNEDKFRMYHPGNQSIVWKLWHSSRIEDMTMNVLIAGQEQVFHDGSWYRKLNIKARDTGNAMDEAEMTELSRTADIGAVKEYRDSVAKRTRSVISSIQSQDLKRKVEPSRLEQLLKDGSVIQAASGLLDYWGKKTCSGLLLMPATRHNLVHINESVRLL